MRRQAPAAEIWTHRQWAFTLLLWEFPAGLAVWRVLPLARQLYQLARRRRSTSTVVRTVVVLRREAPVPADYLFAFTEPVGIAPIWPAATG